MRAVVGRHPHHLGSWDARAVIQLSQPDGTWRDPTPEESGALVGDHPAAASLFTTPAWPSRELSAIDWSDGTPEGDAREQSQFGTYSRRVLDFLTFLGLPLAGRSAVRLVATTGQSPSPPPDEAPGGVVLANVGDVDLCVAFQRSSEGARGVGVVALVLRPREGCVLSPEAWPWAVSLGGTGEFGLHLEVPVLAG